jgi:hypothetical protein
MRSLRLHASSKTEYGQKKPKALPWKASGFMPSRTESVFRTYSIEKPLQAAVITVRGFLPQID